MNRGYRSAVLDSLSSRNSRWAQSNGFNYHRKVEHRDAFAMWTTLFTASESRADIAQIAPRSGRFIFIDGSFSQFAPRKEEGFKKVDTVEQKFREYADKWYAETVRESSTTRIIANSNYKKIIKLGEKVVPFILKELETDSPAPWFSALRILTEQENIGRDNPGDYKKKAEAWIAWYKSKDHVAP